MNSRRIAGWVSRALLLVSALAGAGTARAEVTFQFIYEDATNGLNKGFYDPTTVPGTARTLGEVRREATASAARLLGSYFYNSATVTVFTTSSAKAGLLGSCGSPGSGGTDPGFVRSVMAKKIITGMDDNGAEPDAQLTMNFVEPNDPAWDFSDSVPDDRVDYQDTLIHELTHALGFLNAVAPGGGGLLDLGSDAAGQPQQWYVWDQFLTDAGMNPLIDPTTFIFNLDRVNALVTGLYFAGTNAVLANNGKPVEIYAPATWSDGSSASHVNINYSPKAVMYYIGDAGPGGRYYMPAESGIMRDLGYDVKDPSAPGNLSATQGTVTGKVVLNWRAPSFNPAISNAVGYAVYRNLAPTADGAAQLADNLTGLAYEDTQATPGTTYYYWVRAHYNNGVAQTSLMNRPVSGFADKTPVSPTGSGIGGVVDQVSQSNYQYYLDNLLFTHSGDDRGLAGAQHRAAQTNLFDHFTALGLRTTLEPFTHNEETYYNVVGVLPGTTARSNETYIIGGHYDSVDNPGADDDGSGVAGVMEAARVLSKHQFGATLVFVGFDVEESGLVGSTSYVKQHQNDQIAGMISLDMIAFNGDPKDHAGIYGAEAMAPIKNALSNSIALYGGGLSATIGGPSPDSDHDPFESAGFQACLLIEFTENSLYHQPGDSVDTAGFIDYAYATKMTRAAVGYLATQAGLVDQAQPPTAPVAGQPTEVTSTSLRAVWNPVVNATNYLLQVAGNSGFAAGSLLPGFDRLATGISTAWLVSSLTPDTDYFYRVQAQTSAGLSEYSGTMRAHTTAGSALAAVRISAPSSKRDGTFTFTLSGDPGASCRLQTSTNLVQWMDLNPYVIQGTSLQLTLTNPPGEPKRFYRFMLSSGAGDPTNAASPELDAYVAQWVQDSHVSSVAVGVIRNGQLVYAKGFGLANRETQMVPDADTLYSMASCSKPFVGLSALKLVENGKLKLDEDISTYLGFSVRNPNFPNTAITMRHLLAHVSSIVDADDRQVSEYPRPDPTTPLEDYVRSALLEGGAMYNHGAFWNATQAPGQVNKYANMGSTLAGLVIQKAAGQPFNEFCNQNLFAPLGMDNTRWFYRELPNPGRLALPYDENFTSYGIYGFDEWPSGQIRSSVNDYAKLLKMLINQGVLNGQRILKAESIAEMQRVQFPEADNTACLQLFTSASAQGVTQYFHTGGEAGVVTYFLYDANRGGAIILCNSDLSEQSKHSEDQLMQRLLQESAKN